MPYIPDSSDLFDKYDAERCASLDKLPVCSECDEPIQSEEMYEFNDEYICPECLKDNHRKWVEDFIE